MSWKGFAPAAQKRIGEAKAEVFRARRAYQTAIAEARAYNDDHDGELTPQGVEAHRRFLIEKAEKTHLPRLKELQEQVASDLDMLRRVAAETRPGLGEDAVSWQRAQARWEGVKAKLDAGMVVSQILADADRDTVLAIGEWAPAYLEAQVYAARPSGLTIAQTSGPDLDAIARAVDARLAQLDADGYGSAHAALVEAEGVSEYVTPLLADTLAPAAASGDPMLLALTAHYAEQSTLASRAVTAADPAGDDADAAGEGAA